MDIYSVHGITASGTTNGPTIAGQVRASSTYNDWKEHWAIGNLNGLYGYSTCVFGVGMGRYENNYSFVTVDSSSGIRMMYRSGGADTQFGRWDVSGSLIIGEESSGKSNVKI